MLLDEHPQSGKLPSTIGMRVHQTLMAIVGTQVRLPPATPTSAGGDSEEGSHISATPPPSTSGVTHVSDTPPSISGDAGALAAPDITPSGTVAGQGKGANPTMLLPSPALIVAPGASFPTTSAAQAVWP